MDRRIQKTRQAIMNTFVDLLAEKGFDKITINNIAERANINRGTVYLHYVDKFDLLDKCIETYVEPLIQHCGNTAEPNTSFVVLMNIFEYLEKNLTIFKLFLSNDVAGFFRNRIYTTISQALDINTLRPENNALSYDATIHFFTSGFIGVLEWWVTNSMPCNVQEITEQLIFLVEPYTKKIVLSSIVSR